MIADVLPEIAHLSDASRVWIYPSNRPFSDAELATLRPELTAFCQRWTAHQQQLSAFGEVFFGQFVVLIVDETRAGASGCSIDSSVHFLQEIEKKYAVSLFDRLHFAYLDAENAVHTVNRTELQQRFSDGQIDEQTLFFDHLVAQLNTFKTAWLKPLGESWLRRMIR